MNRRQFLTTLLVAGLAPALPRQRRPLAEYGAAQRAFLAKHQLHARNYGMSDCQRKHFFAYHPEPRR